ncbi:MAG: lytic murein transglycosylase [Rhizobiaceae bacterium]
MLTSRGLGIIAGIAIGLTVSASGALAAQCGNNAGGFEAWKAQMAAEAKSAGIKGRGLQALAATRYATATIKADRGQRSFKYSLQKFMQVRGANAIISRGKSLKRSNAKLFAAIEQRYGVPAGPLLAIWGMETGFGRGQGGSNLLSATATLAYDCRRSAFFTGHLIAALKLVDRGVLSSRSVGAKHGEWGQTQFLPGSVLKYGVDFDGGGVNLSGSKADALASTANFLRAHGWRRGGGYQKGQGNYNAIRGWNAAGVYQQAIAIIASKIDG